MAYQVGPSVCPQCGSSAEVRTARELFDMMNGAREQAFQRINQFRQPGSAPGQWQGAGSADDDDYDHYNVEGSDRQLRGNRGWNQGQRRRDFDFDSGDNVAVGSMKLFGNL